MNRLFSRALVALSLALGAAQAHGQVVINQVWGGGNNVTGSANADFVDLFNKGTSPVNVSGWSVQVAGSTATSWTVVALSGTIPPGGYFLVQLDGAGTTGTALPSPVDAGPPAGVAASAGALLSSGGKVALLSTTTALTVACPTDPAVQDFVGYGTTTNCREGTSTANNAPANSLTAPGSGIRRKTGGCTDTNINSADWEIVTPAAARNSLVNGFAALTGNSSTISAGTSFTIGVSRDAALACNPLTGPLTSATADTSALLGGGTSIAMIDGGGGVFSLNVAVDLAQAGGVYTIPLSISDGTTSLVISYRVKIIGPPPGNDLCANASPLSTSITSIAVDNSTATADIDPGTCNTGSAGNFGVWYVFTPATSGTVIFDETSVQDIASGLWFVIGGANPGADCGTFTASNGLCLSAESWAAKYTAGASYYLQVGSSGTAAPTTGISANLTWLTTAPANDECSTAEVIPGASAWPLAFNADNRFATDDAIDTCATTAGAIAPSSVWYLYTPATPGTFTVSETSAQDVAIAVWDVASSTPAPADCSGFTGSNTYACTTAETLSFHVDPGHSYYVMIHSDLPSPQAPTVPLAGTFSQIPSPANDVCSAATVIPAAPFTSALVDYSTASDDAGVNPSCDINTNTAARYGVWWSYTPPASGVISILRNSPSSEDTVTSVWSGVCGALTQVTCADTDSTVFYAPVTGGQTYRILVSKYGTAALASATTVGITVNFFPAATNDTCASAVDLNAQSFPYSANIANHAATDDAQAVSCNTGSTAAVKFGVWFKYTAATNGSLILNESNSQDAVWAVFSGASCPASGAASTSCLTADTNQSVAVTAGNTYYILLGQQGSGTTITAPLAVTINFAGPATNDACDSATVFTSTPYASPLVNYNTATDDAIVNPSCDTSTNTSARYGTWWAFTPPFSGSLPITRVSPTSEDTVTSVWTGSCPAGPMTQVACVDGDATTFSVPMVGGTTYYILVSKYGTATLSSNVAVGISAGAFVYNAGACCTGSACTVVTPPSCTGYFLGLTTCTAPQATASPNITLPDFVSPTPGAISQTLNVSGVAGAISSLDVSLDISHTFVGDLRIQLQGPGGTTADLSIRPRTTGTGCTTTGAQTNNTSTDLAGIYTFSDVAAQSIYDAVAATPATLASGSYKAASCGGTPVSLNSTFAAESPNGTWTLSITDNAAGDTGTLRAWSISINGGGTPPCSLVGSCCVGSTCSIVSSAAACSGTFTAGIVTCGPTMCAASGICCRGAACATGFADQAACDAAGPALQPGASNKFVVAAACNTAGVNTSPCCYANYNHNASLEVQDIFDFLNDWFAGKKIAIPGGDGSTGTLAVQNIFDFLNAWFAGGCS